MMEFLHNIIVLRALQYKYLDITRMFHVLAIILFITGCQVQASLVEESNKIIPFSQRLANIIEKKCLQKADKTKYDDVMKELHHLTNECMTLNVLPEGISDEKLSKRCIEHIATVTKCLTTLGEKLAACLEPEETYLKQFILDVYNSSSEYFCEHIKVLSVSELLRTNTAKCVLQFQNHPETDPHRVCYENSTIFGDHPTVNVITKSELCHDLLYVDFCYDDVLLKHCSDAPETRQFQSGLILAGLKNCEDATEATEETK